MINVYFENMQNDIINRVIIVGYNTFNCYGVVRSLGEAGIRPDLILARCRVPFVAKSRYAGSVRYFDKPDEVPHILFKEFGGDKEKPIVICCDDPIQSAVDCCYDELKNYFLLSNCGETQGEITRLMNKDVQARYAREAGLVVPQTWHIGIGEKIPADMKYPCIAKPYRSISGSKSDIKICRNEEDLKSALESRKEFIVQQFIEKDFEAIIWGTSTTEYKYCFGGIGKKIRQFPTQWGLSSFGAVESFDEHNGLIKRSVERFLETLRYVGMFSIEMAVKDGKYYFLEINLRNDGKQYFTTKAGVNLPLIYINSRAGRPFEEPKLKTPTWFMGELTDFRQIFKGKVSLWHYLRDLLRTDSFFILNRKDPKPFLYQQLKRVF